jgi:hypothetical protein
MRDWQLTRPIFMHPTVPRIIPEGPFSMPIKAEDPELRRMIDEALAKRRRA